MGARRLRNGRQACAWLLACGLCSVSRGGHAAPSPTTASALQALRQADRLRAEEASEAQAWKEERARLELLLAAVTDRIRAAEAKEQAQADQILQLLAAQTSARPIDDRRRTLGQVANQATSRIHTALDRVARHAPPGVVPAADTTAGENAAGRLDAAVHRLERTEQAASRIHVTLATGQLGAEKISVELLRVGAAAAWYCALDDSGGGTAAQIDGELILRRVDEPRVAAEIQEACDIAKGVSAPRVVVLPLTQTETDGRTAP